MLKCMEASIPMRPSSYSRISMRSSHCFPEIEIARPLHSFARNIHADTGASDGDPDSLRWYLRSGVPALEVARGCRAEMAAEQFDEGTHRFVTQIESNGGDRVSGRQHFQGSQ